MPISPLALDPQGAEPANAFIAGERTLEELPAGGVAEPMADRDNEHAYLVRARGPRDPQELRMARETFEELRSAEADRMRHEWGAEHFSSENFRELYGLHLRSWDYQDEDELEDEPMG